VYITKSSEKITPFGGLNFCVAQFKKSGLAELIDRHLGRRVQTSGFSYSEIMTNLMTVFLAGGDCAEDLSEHLRGPAGPIKGLRLCSADTLLRAVKELSGEPIERVHPQSGISHPFALNELLNDLLIKALRVIGQITSQSRYDLDYDNQVISTEKWDGATNRSAWPAGMDADPPGVAKNGSGRVALEPFWGNQDLSADHHPDEAERSTGGSVQREGLHLAGDSEQ